MPQRGHAQNRPAILYFHTGSFLPPLYNGGITGDRNDSATVEICKRLARMGYVVFNATYRLGWNPAATGADGQNIRTSTLLQAAYRGIQDGRSLARFLRKSVAENSNPYGIDPSRIAAWGQGTGGIFLWVWLFSTGSSRKWCSKNSLIQKRSSHI
ncbi:MAG: hypothetical protein IPH16_21795 [Haliscomenobacter sp.]|nr:hypothetical protein [Haliscomenobacter sp.]